MHHEDSSGRECSRPPRLENERMQFVVLGFVLDEAPVTDDELALALILDLDRSGERDDVDNAVTELIVAGLLRREGKQLWPTRPARIVGTLGRDHG